MTQNRRLQALLFVLQLLGLLLLTQNWFSVAMTLDGANSELGSFDGATTYPVAMPTTLLAVAAVIVSYLVIGWPRKIVLMIGSLVNLLLASWLAIQVSTQNIAALDVQLDRLTGIAKTHGVAGLAVSATIFPWLWLGVCVLVVALGLRLAFSNSPFAKAVIARKATKREQLSSIELWEQQRD